MRPCSMKEEQKKKKNESKPERMKEKCEQRNEIGIYMSDLPDNSHSHI